MKKTLIALAVLAAAGTASAQSSVTLFGVIDASVTHFSTTNAGSQNLLTGDGRNASSRLGFRGTEDLGGGLSASFWLEAAVNIDTGQGSNTTNNNTAQGDKVLVGPQGTAGAIPASGTTLNGRQGLTFNRRSTVSLAGAFGEVRLGRDYVPSFWNMTTFDPFGTVGVGSTLNVSLGTLNPLANSAVPPGAAAPQVRSSNSIGYFLPGNLGGFYGQLMYAFSEVPSQCTAAGAGVNTNACQGTDGDGRHIGGRFGYAAGPLNVALAYGRTTYATGALNAATLTTVAVGNQNPYHGKYTNWSLAGSYDFGVVRAMAQYGRNTNDVAVGAGTGAATTGGSAQGGELKYYLLGAIVPVGSGEIKGSYNYGRYSHNGLAFAAPVSGAAGNGVWQEGSTAKQWALGYVQNFSKRTAAYVTYSRLTVTGQNTRASFGLTSPAAATPGASNTASGYDIGIRHSF